MRVLSKIIATILIYLILTIRPLLGPARCLYTVSCTRYAVELLQTQSLWYAITHIIKRVFRCISLKPSP